MNHSMKIALSNATIWLTSTKWLIAMNHSMKIALSNAHDVKDTGGKFSDALNDAAATAFKKSRKAHQDGTADAHTKAADAHRYAAGKATAENQPAQAATHNAVACGHDAIACQLRPAPSPTEPEAQPPAIPNEALAFSLTNDAEIGADGWCLIAPFGEWPKTRLYRENGQVKQQQFIQVLDNASADAMVQDFNGLVGKIKRWVSAVPVLRGHGDLNQVDAAAISNDQSVVKLGTVDQLRKGARGVEAHFALDPDGQNAIAAGCKYPSGFWYVLPNGKRGDSIIARPFKLISVALTPHPNISGVESLANQKQTPIINMLIPKIAGLLIGSGRAVPENPTEDQIVSALENALASPALANGDYPGHPFHGNQYVEASSSSHANKMSGKANDATRNARENNSKSAHQAAAAAHEKAAQAHEKEGNQDAADVHQAIAHYHQSRANRFK